MKGCILDQQSFDRNDIDLSPLLELLDQWQQFVSSRNDQVDARIDACDVVITNKVRLDRPTLEGASDLKLIMLAATGTDNVDLAACREHGITVCNARQYSSPAVVQHTFTLILSLMTSHIAYQRDVSAGKWSQSAVFCLLDHPIKEIQGRKLGIIGYGNLGSSVAGIARAFGMEVLICQRPGCAKNKAAADRSDGRLPLEQLLVESDVISIHCPLTDDTHHLLGAAEFALMKPDAIVINTARGAIIDVQALAHALRNGIIGGAGIDVLDQEPPAADYPLLAADIPNLILTPHNAWASLESRQRLVLQMANNLNSWIEGRPKNVVV